MFRFNMQKSSVLLLTLSGLGLCLNILAIATPGWSRVQYNHQVSEYGSRGLWMDCIPGLGCVILQNNSCEYVKGGDIICWWGRHYLLVGGRYYLFVGGGGQGPFSAPNFF